MRPAFFRLSLCLLAFAAGCSSSFKKQVVERPELRLSAVAVYPFGFRWNEPAYRSFELSQRLISVGLKQASDRALFLGPSEFKVYRLEDDNAWAASNVVSILPLLGLRPDQTVVLRPWAERRVVSSRQELHDAKGRRQGAGAAEEVTYLGHVEILHPSSREVLVEISGHVQVDPFAERPEFDPSPELTSLMEALTREALDAIGSQLVAPSPVKPWEWPLVFNPEMATRYAEPGRPAADLSMARMDPVELEMFRQARIRFANPLLQDSDAARISPLPGGLWVPVDVPEHGLRAGDIIVAIGGDPALPQAIHRSRFFSSPVRLKVRRATSNMEELSLLPK